MHDTLVAHGQRERLMQCALIGSLPCAMAGRGWSAQTVCRCRGQELIPKVGDTLAVYSQRGQRIAFLYEGVSAA